MANFYIFRLDLFLKLPLALMRAGGGELQQRLFNMEWFLRLYLKGKCILEFCNIQTFLMKF